MKKILNIPALAALASALLLCGCEEKIDRQALVTRNNPHVTEVNPLHSLNLGNGEFTITLDATGLQTFPEYYKDGLSLGTYSEWGWHSFPDTEGYRQAESLEDHPLPGHPHGVYAVQTGSLSERGREAAEWVRSNPHRMHLGNIGFASMKPEEIGEVSQTLDMWNGELRSDFKWNGTPVSVRTVSADEGHDVFAASVSSQEALPIVIRFPYPTGVHSDDASDWNADTRHSTEIISQSASDAVLKRTVDESVYYVRLGWDGKASLARTGANSFSLSPEGGEWSFCAEFLQEAPGAEAALDFASARKAARKLWNGYWKTAGVIDFSHCLDARAPLLEKRVVLSQYLIRVQEAQNFPPAETGMTYNSWFGKFHLEMVMWHSFHYATWNKPELLEKQLDWYLGVMPQAREIAARQGFPGVRWMKMTDPSGMEAPSDVGSFIIWQQPHPIYMAELIYRATGDRKVLEKYYDMVQQSAEFMGAFVSYDKSTDSYIIEGACAANESYNERSTVNPAFEMSYWHFGLKVAQEWRERLGRERVAQWDDILAKLAPLDISPDGIYLPARKGPGIPDFATMTPGEDPGPAAPAGGYFNGIRPKSSGKPAQSDGRDPFYIRATSSENLLAYGMLPACRLFNEENMQKTVERAAENWGWKGGSWSWNYPALMMNATRLHRTDIALRAATMDNRSDLLLPSGNNYRTERLRMYLPGNGGLLLAVGMMCAGWDGCDEPNPGFPKDGNWDVRWEGLSPMP